MLAFINALKSYSRTRQPPSIRRTLVVWLLVPLTLLVPTTTLVFYRLALAPALDLLDHALDGTALALERLVKDSATGLSLPLSPALDMSLRADRYDQVYWVVTGPNNQIIGGDAGLAHLGTGNSNNRPSRADWQFFDALYQDQPVRVALHSWVCTKEPLGSAGRCEVRVAETLAKRHGVQRAVLTAASSAMVVEAMVLVLMGWLAIARGLRPIERLSADIEQRSPEQLGPVNRPDIPHEAAPLVKALNGLFARVTAASTAEKAFLTDAAHQLRTPLTALRTETELALLEPHPPQVEELLRRLQLAASRAARLAHQLLAQARADHDRHNGAIERFDMKKIVSEAAQEWVGRAVEAGVDLGFELDAAPVDGHGFLLREIVANLLDNAIRYAGTGAHVTIRCGMYQEPGARLPPRALLEVEDNGPGIAVTERERVFERFQRGKVGGSGSGLGLSIVRDLARHHRARIELLDGPGGGGIACTYQLCAASATLTPWAETRSCETLISSLFLYNRQARLSKHGIA